MNKRIVFTRADGCVSIVVPAPKARRAGESEEDFLSRVAARAVPAGTADAAVCDLADIPADRTYRGAWKLAGDGLDVDMPKAREIHMGRIRAARDAELLRLDIPQQRALVAKDDAEVRRLEAEKQALRNIPQTLDLTVATTPAELKVIWPEKLATTARAVSGAVEKVV